MQGQFTLTTVECKDGIKISPKTMIIYFSIQIHFHLHYLPFSLLTVTIKNWNYVYPMDSAKRGERSRFGNTLDKAAEIKLGWDGID